jgi:DNA replication protein DnaC
MPTIDSAGLGLPNLRYQLPAPDDFLNTPHGTQEGAARIARHFRGECPLVELQPAERDFLRDFCLPQVAEHRERALRNFTTRVPRRYAHAQPDDAANTWAQAATQNPHATRSLLIVGPTGTGKTHYAYAVLRAVATAGPAAWRAFTAADLYARLRPRDGQSAEGEFEAIAETPLLFIDDLAAAKFTEWTEEITYRLINRRYEQCLPGIFTSNVPPASLKDALGERVASRLTEMCERVALKGPDRRKDMAA